MRGATFRELAAESNGKEPMREEARGKEAMREPEEARGEKVIRAMKEG